MTIKKLMNEYEENVGTIKLVLNHKEKSVAVSLDNIKTTDQAIDMLVYGLMSIANNSGNPVPKVLEEFVKAVMVKDIDRLIDELGGDGDD